MSTVDIADIRAAAARLKGAIERTPAALSRSLSALVGCDLVVKFENLQFTGSFKERGALNRLLGLTPEERARGVLAASAGNHAQALAYHGRRLGVPVTIVMPRGSPFQKIQRTEAHGASVRLEGATFAEAAAFAASHAAERGLVMVHPYDDATVIAGQGTVALELLEDFPDLDMLVVPVGGGGLISGMAVAAKAIRPDLAVLAAQTQAYPSLAAALEGRAPPDGGSTIAEGIAVKQVGALPLALIRPRLDGVLLVDETTIERAVVLLAEVEKTVVEGAGAVGLAVVLSDPERFRGRKVGLVLSGGNIDTRLLASIFMRDLVRQDRMVRLRVEVQDQPGALSRIAGIIGAQGGNIVEVQHQRWFGGVPAKSADLDLLVETMGTDHVDRIRTALAAERLRYRVLSYDED
ncbi:threonine ammonia-lyase [Desertibaculum subflavum]|uniref:threonine ammonia-lyase n=1 Tax=Desertibaculum subflavum TaxID=2268458 RepID=UPI000E6677D5